MATASSHLERFTHNGATLIDDVTEPAAPGKGAAPGSIVNLFFLHGWQGSRESLRSIAVLFQHQYRVHLLDLPGFGEAPPPPADWGTLEYADLVQQYMLDKVPGSIVLIGHSFGSRVSIRLASRRLPQVVAAVLLAAPGLPISGLSMRKWRRWGIRTLRRLLIASKGVTGQRAIDWHTRRFGSADYLSAGVMRSVFVRTVNENLTESAQAVRCPVLLIWGADDTETPLWLGERFKELMGDHATLIVLPHKDHHSIYTGTGGHLCALKIREWLAGKA